MTSNKRTHRVLILAISMAAAACSDEGQVCGANTKLLLFLVCIVFTLIVPRMKTYSYALLVLPAFFIILECVKSYTLVFVFMLFSLAKWTPLPAVPAVKLLWWHYPWLLALMLWILLLQYLRRERASQIGQERSRAAPV